MQPALHQDLADELWEADRSAKPIAPLTERHDGLDIEDAYAIQSINIERRVAAGQKVIGRKVGLTSKPMQTLLGVNEPDFGVLTDEMFVEDGDPIAMSRLVQPRVEAELAFVMERDLAGPGVTTATALTAIAGALPAVEIVDSRVADWKIKLVDTVADNASSGLLVLGGRMRKVEDLDLRLLGVVVSRNGEMIDTGAGAAALGNPARCVAWLANKLGSLGAGLKAGDVVLPGAVHKMVPVNPGDVFRAEFAHLGPVTVRFSKQDIGRGEVTVAITAQEIADTLITSERERKGIAQFSDEHPDIPVETAFEAQKLFVQSKLDAGESFVGWKLGLTSRNKQQAMGLEAPLYGRVTSGMLFAHGEPVRLDRFIHPRVESEIAFLLARDITGPATIASVLAATEVVFGAVDVLDSRYESFKFTLSDVVADNASAAGFYLGPIARRPDELPDLALLGAVVRVDGEVVMTAAGAAVMGHPAASVAYLANELAAKGEDGLKAGQLVFSGGVTAPVPVVAGGSVTFEFDQLGAIEVFGA